MKLLPLWALLHCCCVFSRNASANDCEKDCLIRQQEKVRMLDSLASVALDSQQLDFADSLYEVELSVLNKFPSNSPGVIWGVFQKRAENFEKANRFIDAVNVRRMALLYRAKIYPVLDERYGIECSALADNLVKLKHFQEAESLYKSSLNIFKRNLPNHHSMVKVVRAKLANVFDSLGYSAEAFRLREATSTEVDWVPINEVMKRVDSAKRQPIVKVDPRKEEIISEIQRSSELARDYARNGFHHLAVETFQNVIALRARNGDLNSLGLANDLIGLAEELHSLNNFENPIELLEKAVAIQEQKLGRYHDNVMETYRKIREYKMGRNASSRYRRDMKIIQKYRSGVKR